MTIYSHSRLSTFEQCPLRFKYRYIDKIIPDIGKSIESHLGNTVHSTLEWLYSQRKENKIPSVDEIIIYYSTKWEEEYKTDTVIVKEQFTIRDYFNKGVCFLIDYYTEHHPFDDNTLEIEKKILINLDPEGEYRIQGFIDRLTYNLKKERYEVHDYKTGNNMPTQEKADSDRQLALYSIAIKELFGRDKEIILIWHYLAHNRKIYSKRSNEQLDQLKKETIDLIRQIESTTKFLPYISKLCDWCEYKDICPAWNGKLPKREIQSKLKIKEKQEDFDEQIKQEELDIW